MASRRIEFQNFVTSITLFLEKNVHAMYVLVPICCCNILVACFFIMLQVNTFHRNSEVSSNSGKVNKYLANVSENKYYL